MAVARAISAPHRRGLCNVRDDFEGLKMTFNIRFKIR
jgi:hypothetical protein